MRARNLTSEGVIHIGRPKEAIHALHGAVHDYRTSFRMPVGLASKARDFWDDFRSSENDVYLVALAAWIDRYAAGEGAEAGAGSNAGEAAQGAPAGRSALLNDLLRAPRAWTVADRDAFKEFRDRVVDQIALVLVGRAPKSGDVADLIDELPLDLKEEAVLAGAMLDTPAVLDMLRPRLRADRLYVIDDVHYAFGRNGDALTLERRNRKGRPRILR